MQECTTSIRFTNIVRCPRLSILHCLPCVRWAQRKLTLVHLSRIKIPLRFPTECFSLLSTNDQPLAIKRPNERTREGLYDCTYSFFFSFLFFKYIIRKRFYGLCFSTVEIDNLCVWLVWYTEYPTVYFRYLYFF